MVRLGAVTGSAFDGGGSSSLAFDGKLLNRPSDRGGERPVSNALQLMYYGVYAPPPEAVISPNGDGYAEQQRELSYKVVRPSTVTATLVAPGGAVAFTETLLQQPGTYPVAFPPAPADPTVAPAAPRRAAGGSTSTATDDLGRTSTTSRRSPSTTRSGSRGSRAARSSCASAASRRSRPGVTLTRAGTGDGDRRDEVRRPGGDDRRAPPPGRTLLRQLARHHPRRQVPRLRRHVRRPLPRHERARRGRARLAGVPRHPRGAGAEEEAEAAAANLCAVPVASILSEITDLLTTVVGDYGLYAVFLLMLIDAVFPAASEPVMVYGGAVAAGAFAGQDVMLFGWTIESGFPAYLAVALAGTIGYTLGAIGGWWLGLHGGPPVPRAPRPLAPPERGEARPGRALVRALGGLGRLPRPADAGRALVRLDPGRRLRGAAPPLHRPDAARLRDLVLRPRRHRLGARQPVGGLPSRVPLRRLHGARAARGRGRLAGRGSTSAGAAGPQQSPARLFRP